MGNLLSEEIMLRKNILELMCMNETTLNKATLEAPFVEAANKNYWPGRRCASRNQWQ